MQVSVVETNIVALGIAILLNMHTSLSPSPFSLQNVNDKSCRNTEDMQ